MSDHPAAVAFDRIVDWLREHAPQAADDLNPPANDSALDRLSAAIRRPAVKDLTASPLYEAGSSEVPGEPDPDGPKFGGPLPEELAAVLRRHDGSEGAGCLPVENDRGSSVFYPLSAAEIAENWRCQRDLAAVGEFVDSEPEHTDPGVRETWWDVRWLPFGGDGSGDLVCLDYAPADGGTAGQVYSHETGEHRVLAASLTDYLNAAADAFEAGRFAWDEGEEDLLAVEED